MELVSALEPGPPAEELSNNKLRIVYPHIDLGRSVALVQLALDVGVRDALCMYVCTNVCMYVCMYV